MKLINNNFVNQAVSSQLSRKNKNIFMLPASAIFRFFLSFVFWFWFVVSHSGWVHARQKQRKVKNAVNK